MRSSVCIKETFGIQELEAAAGESSKAVEKDAAVAAAQAAVAAGALAGPGEKDKAAAALEGVDKATAGLAVVGIAPPRYVAVVETTPVVPIGVTETTAALAGVSTAVSGMVDEVVSPRKVPLCSCKEFEVCLPMCTYDILCHNELKHPLSIDLNASTPRFVSFAERKHTQFLYFSKRKEL